MSHRLPRALRALLRCARGRGGAGCPLQVLLQGRVVHPRGQWAVLELRAAWQDRAPARVAHFLEQKPRAAAPGPQKNGQRAELSRAVRQGECYFLGCSTGACLFPRWPLLWAATGSTSNILAVADGGNGLFSLDVTDPSAPVLLGGSPDASVLRVQVAGDRLYALFEGWPRIRSYLATQPADKLGEWSTCGIPCGLLSTSFDQLGNELFAATSQGGVMRLSASAEGSLSQSSQPPLRTRSAVQSVLAGEDVLLGEVGGLALFAPDGSGPLAFDPNGHGDAHAVAVRGHYAYVAASFAGVQTFDISDPVQPRWVGRVDSPGTTSAHDYAGTQVAVAGDVLVLSDGRAGLSLYRLTDPENTGIDRIDLAEPEQPVRAPALRFASAEQHACRTLAVHPSEPVLYMSDIRGIAIYGVGASGELTLLGDYLPPFTENVGSMLLAGERLIAVTSAEDYAAGSINGRSTRLQIFDLRDPLSPAAVWRSEPLGVMSALAVAGQTLFVGGGTNVSVYDLSGLTPELEGNVRTESVIRQLSATSDAVYIAQSTGGLGVLRTGPLTAPSGSNAVALPASPR